MIDMSKETIYCGKCSADVAEDASRCQYCGAHFKRTVVIKNKNDIDVKSITDDVREMISNLGMPIKIKEIYYGEIVFFESHDESKKEYMDMLQRREYEFVDTTSRMSMYTPNLHTRIIDCSDVLRLSTNKERFIKIVEIIEKSGEKMAIKNFEDICAAMLQREIPMSKVRFAERNALIEEICLVLRKKNDVVLLSNVREGDNKPRVPSFVLHMFKINDMRITGGIKHV